MTVILSPYFAFLKAHAHSISSGFMGLPGWSQSSKQARDSAWTGQANITHETVDQTLWKGQGKFHFLGSADHERDWQRYHT